MKLSCTNAMVPGSTLTEKAKRLRDWGYEGIAVFVEYEKWDEKQFDELAQLKDKTKIYPCEFAFSSPIYGHLMDSNTVLRTRARKMYHEAARICSEIGAVTEIEFEYGPQNPLPLFDPYAQMSKPDEEAFLSMYADIARIVDGTAAYVLIEGINRYESPYMNCLEDCQKAVQKLNMPNTGVLADLFHMSIEERDLPESILNTGAYIKHVHLGDSNRLLPGYGHTDWKACIGALKKINYQGFINLECSTCGDPNVTLPKTAVFLKSLL